MGLTYVDISTSPVNGDDHVSEVTWASEIGDTLKVSHYFVNYPGAKDLERQITDIVGGEPLVRYSLRVVLQALISDIPPSYKLAAKTPEQRSLLTSLIASAGLTLPTIITFDDVLEVDDELARVNDAIRNARTEAPKRFGNAL